MIFFGDSPSFNFTEYSKTSSYLSLYKSLIWFKTVIQFSFGKYVPPQMGEPSGSAIIFIGQPPLPVIKTNDFI